MGARTTAPSCSSLLPSSAAAAAAAAARQPSARPPQTTWIPNLGSLRVRQPTSRRQCSPTQRSAAHLTRCISCHCRRRKRQQTSMAAAARRAAGSRAPAQQTRWLHASSAGTAASPQLARQELLQERSFLLLAAAPLRTPWRRGSSTGLVSHQRSQLSPLPRRLSHRRPGHRYVARFVGSHLGSVHSVYPRLSGGDSRHDASPSRPLPAQYE